MMPVAAFYAPMKSPRHPRPSGDRTMARLLWRALEEAGLRPVLASEIRTFEPRGDRDAQEAARWTSEAEAEALVRRYRAAPEQERPRLWFTYHVYYKAPDWLGPRVAAELDIPYVVAEASRAPKRAQGPWALAHAGAEAALDRAATIFAVTPADREALERARPAGQRLVDLPPFLDLRARPALPRRPAGTPVRLLTVAMMRPGDKAASYAQLARALTLLERGDWVLDVVGDGPAHEEIAALFVPFRERVRWHGRIEDPGQLDALYAAADLFVWPAVREAYGMAPLEAQAQGTPVLAGAHGGVPSVVVDGLGGRLAPPDDTPAFAVLLDRLIGDACERERLSAGALRFAREERTLGRAAAILRTALGAAGGLP